MRTLEEQNSSALAALHAHHGRPARARKPRPVYRRHNILTPKALEVVPDTSKPKPAPKLLMTDRILGAVSIETGVPVPAIKSTRRPTQVVTARYAAIWLIRQHCPNMSSPFLGKRLGGRDHSTILNAEKAVAADPERFAAIIQAVEARL